MKYIVLHPKYQFIGPKGNAPFSSTMKAADAPFPSAMKAASSFKQPPGFPAKNEFDVLIE